MLVSQEERILLRVDKVIYEDWGGHVLALSLKSCAVDDAHMCSYFTGVSYTQV